ncbi:IPT/TIG domain-containing protein [Streptomyces sp. CMB-StM0423]|uniref:IPT/TIG domain-containing protein n=1 Tax=Streptomyces sp. CMB-StM0423 TaxID=2059884 RepID=UPI00131BF16D|nr:IPT/TIG domain-containing protein [Streptomyces sp. CMB-StM0423]
MSVGQAPPEIEKSGSSSSAALPLVADAGPIPVGPAPHSVAMRPDGLRAYVTNSGGNTLSVIDTAANAVVTTIGVGAGPWDAAVTPNGRYVYVTMPGSGTVAVVDTATDTLVGTVSGLNAPRGLAVTPDGTRVYVANSGANTVSVISTATNTVTGTITVGNGPQVVTVRPDGLRAYVSNSPGGAVSVIATVSNTVVSTVTGFQAPLGVAAAPDGTRVYVANSGARQVSVIGTATNTVTDTITVASSPSYLTASPDGTLVYASMTGAGSLAVINSASNSISETIPGFAGPHEVATTPAGGYLYVVDHGDNMVDVLRKPTTISPNTGPRGGGTTVIIKGRGFLGTTAVSFGIRPVTDFAVVSDTTLTLTAPSAIRSAVPVTVTASGGTAIIGHYYYRQRPVLHQLSATSGSTSGGNTITVTGQRFVGVKTVRFGTVEAPATVLSDTQLTVTIPPSAPARTIPVYVVSPGGVSNSLSYTYLGSPAITSISPISGPRTGSRIVNINGTFLSQVTSVTFGGVPALSTKIMSDVKMQTVTPATSVPGPVAVVARASTGATATSPQPYTYT